MGSLRGATIADLHAGHVAGLTPPGWRIDPTRGKTAEQRALSRQILKLEEECWDYFVHKARQIRPLDFLNIVGDCIDGRGEKSGGLELLTADREEQCDMAEVAIKKLKAKKIVMVRGTGYHTGDYEEWENRIAKELGAEIRDHAWPEVHGVVFDLKHFVRAGQLPHTRSSGVAKEWLHNFLWSEHKRQPRADVIVRAHAHCYAFVGGVGWAGMVCPALQAAGTRFGKKCSAEVDYGLIEHEVFSNGGHRWWAHILRPVAERARTIKLY